MREKLEKIIRSAGAKLLSGEGRTVTEKEGIGNYVTVPSSYVTRITVRMEEIYDE